MAKLNGNIELYKLYYDEWKYRLDHFRKQIIQLFIVIFFTSTFPVTINLFEHLEMPKVPLLIFPIIGLVVTVLFLWYCFSEAMRISSLDSTLKKILSDIYEDAYTKNELIVLTNHKALSTLLNIRMTKWIPVSFAVIQWAISIFMIVLILSDKI